LLFDFGAGVGGLLEMFPMDPVRQGAQQMRWVPGREATTKATAEAFAGGPKKALP